MATIILNLMTFTLFLWHLFWYKKYHVRYPKNNISFFTVFETFQPCHAQQNHPHRPISAAERRRSSSKLPGWKTFPWKSNGENGWLLLFPWILSLSTQKKKGHKLHQVIKNNSVPIYDIMISIWYQTSLEPLKSLFAILRYQTSRHLKIFRASDPRSVTSQDPCDHRKVPQRAKRICATTAAPEPRWELPTCGFTDGWLMGEGWSFSTCYGPLIWCWLVGLNHKKMNENQFSDEEIRDTNFVRNSETSSAIKLFHV